MITSELARATFPSRYCATTAFPVMSGQDRTYRERILAACYSLPMECKRIDYVDCKCALCQRSPATSTAQSSSANPCLPATFSYTIREQQ